MKTLLALALLVPLSVFAAEEDKLAPVMPAQPVNPVVVTPANEVCSGSSNVGVHILFIGFNYAVKWTDEGCTLRRNSRTMSEFGDSTAAKALLCSDKKIRLAYKQANHPCQEDITLATKADAAAQNGVPQAPKVIEKPKASFLQQ